MSASVRSKRASICATLASRLACDSATPFGAPSEPEVNSTTAGSSGSRCASARPARQRGAELVRRRRARAQVFEPDDARDVPDRLDRAARACPCRRRRARSGRAPICAVSQAATRLCAPAVKLSIAGTRPAACSAMKATAAPLAFGSIRPTVSPGAVIAAILRASTRDADAKHAQAHARRSSGSCDRDAAKAARASPSPRTPACRVRRMSVVSNTRSDMMS